MTIEARINLQKGLQENKVYSGTNYTSDGSLIDQYVLAKVRMKQSQQQRIILDPAAYDALISQVSRDIKKEVVNLFKTLG